MKRDKINEPWMKLRRKYVRDTNKQSKVKPITPEELAKDLDDIKFEAQASGDWERFNGSYTSALEEALASIDPAYQAVLNRIRKDAKFW